MAQPKDSLSVEDDELDRHDCMLPLIHLVEKAAALFQVLQVFPSWGWLQDQDTMQALCR